jgi:murein DD-endopeptidase MepM/ murein hydrolase activator NlpD
MVDFKPSASGRGLARTTYPRTPRQAAAFGAALLLGVLVLVALLPAASRSASLQAIQANINDKQAAIDRARAKEGVLTSDISNLSKRIRTLTREIGSLRRREARVQNTLDARRAQLARVQARYQVEHERFVRLRRELHRSQAVLAKRLIEIYKADQPDMLSVILESDGFNDLLVRADYMSAIGEQDSGIVDKVRELKKKSAQKRLLLVVLRSRAKEAVRVIEVKQRQLQEARAAIQANEADLASARRYKYGKLGNVEEHRHELEGDLRALQAASARVTSQLQGAGPLPAGPVRQGGGGYIWPVNGPVVSPFGQRWGRLHAGVDIAVPAGTPIRAAASGSVAMAGWMGGYGQYTCIQHGGGVATCYAHQSSIGVGTGASVKQGQVIGSVGCTGHCFGDHLHFEVRINGSPVDPMGYL